MSKNVNGRINVNPASRRIPVVEKAQRALLKQLVDVAKAEDWEGTIDVDYFDEEAGAFFPLIVELFPRDDSNRPKHVEVAHVYPVSLDAKGRVTKDEAEMAVDSIVKETPNIVYWVRKTMKGEF